MLSTEMALVPAAEFQMGDPGGREDERPVHRVYVSVFRMAVCPVTNREYAAFLEAAAHEEPRFWNDAAFTEPLQPVVGVSWFDAIAYCDWLSSGTGRTHRLPTEAEREKAARGGSEGSRYPWGDEPPADGRRRTRRIPSGRLRRTATASSTWGTTCTSGAWTGMTPSTTAHRRFATPVDRRAAPAARRVAGRGAIRLRSAAAPHAAVCHHRFATTTTAFAS
jgi:formylglycine-generating enzyme required for sulfatase activity